MCFDARCAFAVLIDRWSTLQTCFSRLAPVGILPGGDHKSVDANGNPVAGEGGRRGRRGDSGHDGSDSDGGSMSSGSDGEGGRLGGLCQPGTEQTGRWTKDEHELFLKVGDAFGRKDCVRFGCPRILVVGKPLNLHVNCMSREPSAQATGMVNWYVCPLLPNKRF